MFTYYVPDHIDPFWETEERGRSVRREEALMYLKHDIPVSLSCNFYRAAAKFRVWEKRLIAKGVCS